MATALSLARLHGASGKSYVIIISARFGVALAARRFVDAPELGLHAAGGVRVMSADSIMSRFGDIINQ